MAKWLERWTTDPRVVGSNLTFDTKNLDFEYVFLDLTKILSLCRYYN